MHYPYDVGKSLMSSFKLPAGVFVRGALNGMPRPWARLKGERSGFDGLPLRALVGGSERQDWPSVRSSLISGHLAVSANRNSEGREFHTATEQLQIASRFSRGIWSS
jgi:hypothetical protein